jgi:hypothetical protein
VRYSVASFGREPRKAVRHQREDSPEVAQAAIVALRVRARLPLDDVFIALKDVIPQLARASRHRCL